jgi:hypothetical protein
MKKLLLLLLIAPVVGYGQVLTDILYISGYSIEGGIKSYPNSVFGYTFLDGTIIYLSAPHDERVRY